LSKHALRGAALLSLGAGRETFAQPTSGAPAIRDVKALKSLIRHEAVCRLRRSSSAPPPVCTTERRDRASSLVVLDATRLAAVLTELAGLSVSALKALDSIVDYII
jgi:hypothetical protein